VKASSTSSRSSCAQPCVEDLFASHLPCSIATASTNRSLSSTCLGSAGDAGSVVDGDGRQPGHRNTTEVLLFDELGTVYGVADHDAKTSHSADYNDYGGRLVEWVAGCSGGSLGIGDGSTRSLMSIIGSGIAWWMRRCGM
jgi:hypothetical protein